MYYTHLAFMVGSSDMYGSIFLSNVPPPTYHYTFLICNILVLWNYGDVVVGLWITLSYLSVNTKLCCDSLNEDFAD